MSLTQLSGKDCFANARAKGPSGEHSTPRPAGRRCACWRKGGQAQGASSYPQGGGQAGQAKQSHVINGLKRYFAEQKT